MSYVLVIHPQVRDDVLDIFLYLDQHSPAQADRFVESVLESYDHLISELNKQVFLQATRKVKSRPIGKFKRHLMYYTVDKKNKKVMVLAICYGGRNPEEIDAMINGRLQG
ncbi:MAG: type II toxin-antitoxin system RelE/ParE family toxin [Bacteroidetes bacterium]|nr:MAG: type II toxin-antitoxin system RelE/ParE family toxin [Bacteroidota bacterium]